jgi:hypothetical protein
MKQMRNYTNQMSSEKLRELIGENINIIQEYFDFKIKQVCEIKVVKFKV